jgi:hypothetical protein
MAVLQIAHGGHFRTQGYSVDMTSRNGRPEDRFFQTEQENDGRCTDDQTRRSGTVVVKNTNPNPSFFFLMQKDDTADEEDEERRYAIRRRVFKVLCKQFRKQQSLTAPGVGDPANQFLI